LLTHLSQRQLRAKQVLPYHNNMKRISIGINRIAVIRRKIIEFYDENRTKMFTSNSLFHFIRSFAFGFDECVVFNGFIRMSVREVLQSIIGFGTDELR
jgi:hypothetical protein